MLTAEPLQIVVWAVFLTIFVRTLQQLARKPTRAQLNATLFFAVPAVLILIEMAGYFRIVAAGTFSGLSIVLLLLIPYLLLRLLQDQKETPRVLRYAAAAVIPALGISVLLKGLTQPLLLASALYFVAVLIYCAYAFTTSARSSKGVTCHRLRLVAFGCYALGGTLLVVALQVVFRDAAGVETFLLRTLSLAAGVLYFLGFTPPGMLRRAWQAPGFNTFLAQAAELPLLPDGTSVLKMLQEGAAATLGSEGALVGLWEETTNKMRFWHEETGMFEIGDTESLFVRSWRTQLPDYSQEAARGDPTHGSWWKQIHAHAVMTAPITAAKKQHGVLVVYSKRANIFIEDDLSLLLRVAEQVAAVLERRESFKQAALVRALKETTLLKDDFLAAAAHDLKTPLTVLSTQVQLLELKLKTTKEVKVSAAEIERLSNNVRRMTRLVSDLLGAARSIHAGAPFTKQKVDLVAIAREISLQSSSSYRHNCVVEGPPRLFGWYEQARLEQLFQNLVDNAIKYSPAGGVVLIKLRSEGENNIVTVSDQGVGVPAQDIAHIFERFHRGANVADKGFSGMGLGLYICHNIVTQQGGTITVASEVGKGTTFTITLPVGAEDTKEADDAGTATGG